MSQRWRVVLGGYAFVLVFAVALGLIYYLSNIAHEARGWSEPSLVVVGIAAIVAGPLAVALLWERITGVRLLGIEVSLASIRSAAPPIDAAISQEFHEVQQQVQQFGPLGTSGLKPIGERTKAAVRAESAELVEIDLGNGEVWWQTRLFLLAALMEE